MAQSAAGIGVWEWDAATGRTTWSPEVERLYGLAPGSFGGNQEAWLALVHPDDLDAVNAAVQGVAAQQESFDVEFRIRHASGTVRWLASRGTAEFDDRGRVKHVMGVNFDITERKQAEGALDETEKKLRSIFRAAPVGIGVVTNRVITEVNETFCNMVGYVRDELVGQSARVLYPRDEDYEFVGREKYRQIKAQGYGSVETCFRRKDGAVIHIHLSSAPIDTADPSRGVSFAALDITERKEREAELQRLTRTERAIGHSRAALLHAVNEGDYLRAVCRIASWWRTAATPWYGSALPSTVTANGCGRSPWRVTMRGMWPAST
jgi:PAS domain S-box-containing protein